MKIKFCGWTHKWHEGDRYISGRWFWVTQCTHCGKVKSCWLAEEEEDYGNEYRGPAI